MFITNPELQNPHCVPLYCASVVEIGLYSPVCLLDSASIVVTEEPSTLQSGRRHEFTLIVVFFCWIGSYCVSDTTHAPHPPSWHDFLVP